ncbi:ATPase AFG2 protein [Salpingoeca rosetta]|uniref:ATPase AFG2 protein n=1 Tax=Salpingoeca rosetta (strain ATCC 50818 / BSB-021) TaxID=946362 RepID=F2U5D7_SALR5|nr:ATPase AFG2 protein [Salpingoeca rosetta]EGD83153.1 ATPase AFG2 protein [Salpingoeca rosetta]|eukprot:XP_004995517.1 ATPase AFG2 protein [Salpingoeca rosetta]
MARKGKSRKSGRSSLASSTTASAPGTPHAADSRPRLCKPGKLSKPLPPGSVVISSSWQQELGLKLFDYVLLSFPDASSTNGDSQQHPAVIARVLPHFSTRKRVVLSPDLRESFQLPMDALVSVDPLPAALPFAHTVVLSGEGFNTTDVDVLADSVHTRLLGLAVTKDQRFKIPFMGGHLGLTVSSISCGDSASRPSLPPVPSPSPPSPSHTASAPSTAAEQDSGARGGDVAKEDGDGDAKDPSQMNASTFDAVRRFAIITARTRISIAQPEAMKQKEQRQRVHASASADVSYADVGGLAHQLQEVRDTVELALQNPQIFTQYGLAPPRGVLLVGPPGTGKTLIARAVARECGADVTVINGPEIISRTYGETERSLKAIFAKAAPSGRHLIFVDEIDAMCPARDAATSDLEKRIVTTMLTLMDGIAAKHSDGEGRVVVLAATNRPDALDPALRRPGRFDREVDVGVPNAMQRRQILRVLLRRFNHTCTDEDIDDVADRAHGYVGADLAAVCREAGLSIVRRAARTHSSNTNDGADDDGGDGGDGDGLTLRPEDLRFGLSQTRPSAMREVVVDVPRVTWADIGGNDDIKQCLKEAVEWPLKYSDAFVRLGIRPPSGILMYGPPGCSKTLMAKALANESHINFIAVKGPELFSKWVGESERAVREVFRKARAAAPSIIFFDEIDALGARRGSGQGSSVADRVLTQLLVEMDGVDELRNVTVVAATNRPDMVDAALLRPGRFDRKVYVGPPTARARAEILRMHLSRVPHASDVDVHDLAAQCDGFSGAEVASICREAALLHVEASSALAHQRTRLGEEQLGPVPKQAFLDAIKRVTPNITADMLAFYDRYRHAADQ